MKAIVIHIINKSTDVKRVSVFNPDYEENGISIESGISNLTYKEICRALFYQLKMSFLYVSVFKADGKEPVNQNFALGHMDLKIEDKTPDGCSKIDSVSLGLDPYQQQLGMVVSKNKRVIDQFTYFHFNTYPGMKYLLNIYLDDGSGIEPGNRILNPGGELGKTDMTDSIKTYVDPASEQPTP